MQMLYVANFRRPEAATPDAALALLRDIEAVSGLAVTHLVGNTHLKDDTDEQTVRQGAAMLASLARLSELPVAFIAAPRRIAAALGASLDGMPLQPVEILIRDAWQ
jgi:hypothetical protein